MTSPLPASQALLTRNHMASAVCELLVADASPRRYFRLRGETHAPLGLLLMEDPTDAERFAAWLRVGRHLCALGLSAPQIHDTDTAGGVALIEDFGEESYAACLAAGEDEAALYRLAVDALLRLHHDSRALNIAQPDYDMGVLLKELELFSDWFAPAVAPPGFSARDFAQGFFALWREALAPVASRFETLILRDFHIDNLMLLSGREGVSRCGMLDFQDAFLGPCEYDLVSLLQDARRDLSPGLEEEMFRRYVAAAPASLGDADDIHHRYTLLGAQRHARILGIFTRLWQRDAKPRYLTFMWRVARQFRAAMREARLYELENFLDAELPNWETRATRLQAEAAS